MLRGFALRVIRFRWLVVLLAAGFLAGGAVLSLDLHRHLSIGGFWADTDESTRAEAEFGAALPNGPRNLILLARNDAGADSPAAVAAGQKLTQELAGEPALSSVTSYWATGSTDLRSADQRTGLVLARIGGNEDQRKEALLPIYDRFHGTYDGLSIRFAGQPAVEREVTERSGEDLQRLELLSTPVVAVLLLLIFGSIVASLLPLVIGLTAIVGTLVTLRVLTIFTPVSVYSLNIATALSLGLAIDYGLFVVTRYREELDKGLHPVAAVANTIVTAGRTVLFSALVVALSLSALLVFPLYYLRSFAYSGIAVVGFAALSALVLLPAVLMLLGHRVDKLDVRAGLAKLLRRKPAAAGAGRLSTVGKGGWHRLASFVMRRPLPLATGAILILLVLGSPFLQAKFALPDETNLPSTSESAQVTSLLREEFPALGADAMYVVSPDSQLSQEDTQAYATKVSQVDGVVRVDSAAGVFADGEQLAPPTPLATQQFTATDASWLSVALSGPPQGDVATAAAEQVRALPESRDLLVGGVAAHLVDTKATLATYLPWALLIVAVSTLLVLFLFTGSVLIPVKAVVLNLLSLTATFGAAVWIFQQGHLAWLVGDFQVSGTVEMTTIIMLFAIAFGLSMDYEVFLLSRIKEEYDRTGDNTAAVAVGLQRTGKLITYAAMIFVVVMLAFATSTLGILKLVGIGLGLAVFVDATLVRAVLVPAVMRLAGRANWWAPRWLRRVHDRVGLHEDEPSRKTEEPRQLALVGEGRQA